MIGKVFTFSTTVYFDELDALGVLHHPRYFHHLERAQQAFFETLLGVSDFDADRDEDIYVVVHSLEAAFKAPVRKPGKFEVRYTLERVRAGGVTMGFEFTDADGVIYSSGRRTVCKLSAATHRPAEWSAPFRLALDAWRAGE
jgi:acyl-CoA thioester hydrolase